MERRTQLSKKARRARHARSRSYQLRQQAQSKEVEQEPTQKKGSRSFAIRRKLDRDIAEHIRLGASEIFQNVGGAVILGYGNTNPASLTEIGHYETRNISVVREVGPLAVVEAMKERLPSLDKPLIMEKKNIGKFGKMSRKVSLAAALYDTTGQLSEEIGESQLILCELNNWNPLHHLPSQPHVTLVSFPGNTSIELLDDLKVKLDKVVPQELIFDHAEFSVA